MSVYTMTCPGCREQVFLDNSLDWQDADGTTCRRPWATHGEAVLDRLGRAFHEAGERVLAEANLAQVVQLPAWDKTTEMQRWMVYAGVTAVAAEMTK